MSSALVPLSANNPFAVVVGAPGMVGTPGFAMAMPALIAQAGEHASRATFGFFVGEIANAYTRRAYARAVGRFCAWCDVHGVRLDALDTGIAATYVRGLEATLSLPSVKLAASAIRIACARAASSR